MFALQSFVAVLIAVFWSGICLAQGVDPALATAPIEAAMPDIIPTADWLMMLFNAIGGFKGMSTLGIVAAVSQLLLKGLQTPLADHAKKYKLLAITGLTLIAGVLGLMTANDMPFMAAVMHSTTLASFQVFVHQIWKQFVKNRDEKKES